MPKEIRLKDLVNSDFKKCYDIKSNIHYWILGYFGGGPISIMRAFKVAEFYAEEHNVPIEEIYIDEISCSQKFKGFKIIYSNVKQDQGAKVIAKNDVYSWLTN